MIDKKEVLKIDGDNLTIKDFVQVARHKKKVELSEEAKKRIVECRKVVDQIVDEEKIVYGLTTGFGSLANVTISKQETEKLQENLLRTHACSVGDPFSEEVVRGIMLLRLNTFAKGFSGIRLSTVKTIVEMLNKEVYPFVPEKGSVGSSGDLSPLSHLFLVLMGEGKAFYEGKIISGKDAMLKVGINPVKLTSKEGLALNNGTPVMTSIAALAVSDVENLIKHSILSSSMSLESLKANTSAFFHKIQEARPHKGQIVVAKLLRKILLGSKLVDSVKDKVQDAYSLRATPVVIGASLDTLNYVKSVVEIEINSATDNPLIFDGKAYSGANFHGQPIALVMDFLAIAVSELGNLAERRISRILDKSLSEGLPPFLVEKSGLNSGFMIPQYTAAALINENKVLCHPASVDSIPTCANQEDHVSMGTNAARKLIPVIKNVESIIAIELLIGSQALEIRMNQGKNPGKVVMNLFEVIRTYVSFMSEDREIYPDIIKLESFIRSRKLLNELNSIINLEGDIDEV